MGMGWRWLGCLLLLVGCTGQPRGPLVFLTDFGLLDDAVSVCKGVMLGIEPRLTIVDLTHDVPPQNLHDASRFLAGAADYYPSGTTFVVVVDPGVGTDRRAIVVRTKKDHYIIAPDNGVVTPVLDRDGLVEAREITHPDWRIGNRTVSSTFHGRDLFSPSGARIASNVAMTGAGPKIKDLVRLPPQVSRVNRDNGEGVIVGLDGPYGNLITNFTADQIQQLGYEFGDSIPVKIGKKAMALPFRKAFNFVERGKPLAYIDSKGFLAFAINQGNFSKEMGLGRDLPVQITGKP